MTDFRAAFWICSEQQRTVPVLLRLRVKHSFRCTTTRELVKVYQICNWVLLFHTCLFFLFPCQSLIWVKEHSSILQKLGKCLIFKVKNIQRKLRCQKDILQKDFKVHLVCFIRNTYKERLFERPEILTNLRNRDSWILDDKEHPKPFTVDWLYIEN